MIVVSCSSSTSSDDQDLNVVNDQYTIINNQDELDARMEVFDNQIELEIDTTLGDNLAKKKYKADRFRLLYIAQLLPPVIDGEQVQATMIYNDGSSQAFVSYNMRGAPYIGSVDLMQSSWFGILRLRSSIQFNDTDVNAVIADENQIFTAVATSDEAYTGGGSASVIQSYAFNGNQFRDAAPNFAPLQSFAANSVFKDDEAVYVTTGNTGGLSIYNEDLSELQQYIEIAEARWVTADANRIYVLAGDTDGDQQGTLYLIDKSTYQISSEFAFPGAYTPEAKNTVEVIGNLAFIAAGKEGVQIMNLSDGSIEDSIPIPDAAELGLSDDVVTTNSVTVEDELIFISNGEAGVYVAANDLNFIDLGIQDALDINVLGRIQFPDLQSANHVILRGGVFNVAAGLGGTKTVWLIR
jgi:hypothetical protein